jgi:hypothetical protein
VPSLARDAFHPSPACGAEAEKAKHGFARWSGLSSAKDWGAERGPGVRVLLLFGTPPYALMARVAPPRARYLIRCAHPSGQPAAVTSLRYVVLACPRKSNQKEGHPYIRPRLRRGSLTPSPLQGHAGCGPPTKGHPWPIAALATSMSLNPLRGDSIRPPEGDLGVVCAVVAQKQSKKQTP